MYDFIVIGSGPSGTSLAARLAGSPSAPKILLLEAGPEQLEENRGLIAERWSSFMQYPGQNWNYSTVAQKECNNREISLAQGKGLGGGTLINMCVWTTGPKDDYDRMAAEVGDEMFNWKSRVELRERIESMQDRVPAEYAQYAKPDMSVHGIHGAVRVEWPAVWEEPILNQLEAAKACGLGFNADLNCGNPLGHASVPSTSCNGRRVTANMAYLSNRLANLDIICQSHCSKVIFEGKKAVGVEANGIEYRASKEVVISAGAIASPQLLMLSGIGPVNTLATYNIPVVQELSGVGQGLEDHYFAVHSWRARDGFNWPIKDLGDQGYMKNANDQFAADGSGPLAKLFGSISIGFYKLDEATESPAFSELPSHVRAHLNRPTVPLWESSLLLPPFAPHAEPGVPYMTAAIILQNPQSRGSVTLSSTDPHAAPVIDPQYFSHPFDRQVAVAAERRLLRDVLASPLIAKDIHLDQPLNAPASDSEEDILGWWRENGTSTWHPACTVRMGLPDQDPKTCVDSNFRVHGVQSLRVVDLSVLPFLPNCHVQSWAYFLGEVAAVKLQAEYGLDS